MERQWTTEQKEYIITEYTQKGRTLGDIGKEFGAKASTISKYLNQWGINTLKNKGISANRLLNHNYFENIDSPDKAYFLGLLFTDGSITPKSTRQAALRIELVEYDKDILELFRDALGSNADLGYNKRDNREYATYTLSIRSDKIAEDLGKWNIVPNKTYTVNNLVIPEQYKADYLRGIIDGDGSVYWSNNGWHINVCGHSQDIIKQIAQLGNELLGDVQMHTIACSDNVYRYSWNGVAAERLAKIIYLDTNSKYHIERKYNKAKEMFNK